MPDTFHIDWETRSGADLPKVGAYRYAYDPDAKILCAAVSKNDGEPRIWRCDRPDSPESRSALDMMGEIVRDPSNFVYAHNAQFEVAITDALWERTFGFPPPAISQWRCTAVMARRAALPYSLGKLADCLGLDQQKDKAGLNLIKKFCIPEFTEPEDAPEDFEKFLEYCRQDVRTEQAVHKALHKFELHGLALDAFIADMEMNRRGIPINLDAVENAQKVLDEVLPDAEAEFRRLTGLNVTQQGKVLAWLQGRGYEPSDLQRTTMDEWLESDAFDQHPEVAQALSIRRNVSFAANKKLPAMSACAGPHDNKVRGTLMFCGASRTGRWSGSLLQIQNVKKPPPHLEKHTKDIYRMIQRGASAEEIELYCGNPLEAVASCMRHFIDDGKPILQADYSAIEARVIAWLAGEEWQTEVFRTHGMIYEATAGRMFNVPIDEFKEYKSKNNTHHPLRNKGKIASLALGFSGSVNALITMGALNQGLLEDELQPIVDAWRAANPNIVSFWNKCEDAAKAAIRNPGRKFEVNRKVTYFTGRTAGMNFLFARLPSGRCLSYPQPRLEMVPAPWDKEQMIEQIMFFGQLPMKSTWGRVSTYRGRLVENLTQAVAADVMSNGLVNCEKHGYRVFALIHDEALVYKDSEQQSVDELIQLMTELPEWATGLPLAAAGDEIPFYLKD